MTSAASGARAPVARLQAQQAATPWADQHRARAGWQAAELAKPEAASIERRAAGFEPLIDEFRADG